MNLAARSATHLIYVQSSLLTKTTHITPAINRQISYPV